jgi:hypothetical protein
VVIILILDKKEKRLENMWRMIVIGRVAKFMIVGDVIVVPGDDDDVGGEKLPVFSVDDDALSGRDVVVDVMIGIKLKNAYEGWIFMHIDRE